MFQLKSGQGVATIEKATITVETDLGSSTQMDNWSFLNNSATDNGTIMPNEPIFEQRFLFFLY